MARFCPRQKGPGYAQKDGASDGRQWRATGATDLRSFAFTFYTSPNNQRITFRVKQVLCENDIKIYAGASETQPKKLQTPSGYSPTLQYFS
jgi:hypothetical protein